MEIVIIGSGNVASVLGRKAMAAGHTITQVVSRNVMHAKTLAESLDCQWGGVQEIDRSAMLYIVAITDAALLGIAHWLTLDKAIVVHTAGSVSIHALKEVSHNYGVLYPLQSMSRATGTIPDFPLLVDGNTPECLTVVQDFAQTISGTVELAGDEDRQKLHLAAVVSGNFSNHLYALVHRFCEKEGVNFNLLLPMLHETITRLQDQDPKALQTGPAVRRDLDTIKKHLSLLEHHPEMHKIYALFSESIQQYHS